MMNKQEQIEEMAKIIDELYNVYDTTAGDIAEGLYNTGYRKEQETAKEIERLKAENIRLTTKLGQVLLSIDTVKEMNTMCSIDEQRKQAKIDVLNELKEKCKFDGHTVAVYKNDIDDMIVEVEKCRR